MSTLNDILKHKIVAILRGANPADVLKISEALYNGGIRILEITMNSTNPLQVIEELNAKFGDKMVIGAGTVLDTKMAKDAVAAGAKFILSPIVDVDVIKAAKDMGVIAIPGAHTPTEIAYAYKNGGDIIKVFPSTSPAYIKDVLAPLNHVPLLPTGGINLENIKQYLHAGAVGFGMGSALVNTKMQITDAYLAELTETAKKFVAAIAVA
jgi:2-dehydro-3-deoxyphosphogluconate aldolase / (4S)-4-hydroxy-2-oxoglutarate aldolase